MTLSAPRITVAVCTRDRPVAASMAIGSLLADRDAGVEVLVVDQSKGDETQNAMARLDGGDRVRYERIDSIGIGASRRAAVELATTELIAFTDDDCTVPPRWASTIADVLDRRPDLAMLFCTVRAGPHDEDEGFIPTYECTNRTVRTMLQKCTSRGIGAGMAVRKGPALSVGSFDSALGSFFVGACEEGDLAVRLLLAGFPVGETDRTFVVHHGLRTWAEGRALAHRNFRGVGLAYSKPIRTRRWRALVVVAYEGVVVSLLGPILAGRRPSVRAVIYFWRGFGRGLTTAVDRHTMNFRPSRSSSRRRRPDVPARPHSARSM